MAPERALGQSALAAVRRGEPLQGARPGSRRHLPLGPRREDARPARRPRRQVGRRARRRAGRPAPCRGGGSGLRDRPRPRELTLTSPLGQLCLSRLHQVRFPPSAQISSPSPRAFLLLRPILTVEIGGSRPYPVHMTRGPSGAGEAAERRTKGRSRVPNPIDADRQLRQFRLARQNGTTPVAAHPPQPPGFRQAPSLSPTTDGLLDAYRRPSKAEPSARHCAGRGGPSTVEFASRPSSQPAPPRSPTTAAVANAGRGLRSMSRRPLAKRVAKTVMVPRLATAVDKVSHSYPGAPAPPLARPSPDAQRRRPHGRSSHGAGRDCAPRARPRLVARARGAQLIAAGGRGGLSPEMSSDGRAVAFTSAAPGRMATRVSCARSGPTERSHERVSRGDWPAALLRAPTPPIPPCRATAASSPSPRGRELAAAAVFPGLRPRPRATNRRTRLSATRVRDAGRRRVAQRP